MEEHKVIPKKKLDKLYNQDETLIERSLSTRELMALAIKWGVTRSAAEFWREHKSKEELVQKLRQKKAELEYEAPEEEEGPMDVTDGVTERQQALDDEQLMRNQKRRNSLAELGDLMTEDVQYTGDIFGQRGDYTGGMMYAMRRRSSGYTSDENRAQSDQGGLTAAQWQALKCMQAGADENLPVPGGSGDGEFESRPGTSAVTKGRAASEEDADVDKDLTVQLRKVEDSVADALVRDKRDGMGHRTASAHQLQAFIEERKAADEASALHTEDGGLIGLHQWVERNAPTAATDVDADVENSRDFAKSAMASAIGVDALMADGGLGSKAMTLIDMSSSITCEGNLTKTLRGVSTEPPRPSEGVQRRNEVKLQLYHRPLEHQVAKPVPITPREPEGVGLPPILAPGETEPGSIRDQRYGYGKPLDEVAADEKEARIMGNQPRHTLARPYRNSSARMSGRVGGLGGPIPSPMTLPSPSHPIMAATTGTGTGHGPVTATV